MFYIPKSDIKSVNKSDCFDISIKVTRYMDRALECAAWHGATYGA